MTLNCKLKATYDVRVWEAQQNSYLSSDNLFVHLEGIKREVVNRKGLQLTKTLCQRWDTSVANPADKMSREVFCLSVCLSHLCASVCLSLPPVDPETEQPVYNTFSMLSSPFPIKHHNHHHRQHKSVSACPCTCSFHCRKSHPASQNCQSPRPSSSHQAATQFNLPHRYCPVEGRPHQGFLAEPSHPTVSSPEIVCK